MTPGTKAGRSVGGLMLLHLAIGLIGPYVVLVPITAPPGGFLENAAPAAGAIRASVLVLIAAALIPIFTTLVLAPVAWARARSLSCWLFAIAVAHLALQLVENVHWLTMLSVSEAYQTSRGTSELDRAALSVLVRNAFKWAHYSHILVLVAWLLVLFSTLGKARLIPRWLAVMGLVAALLHFAGITLPEFVGYRVSSGALWGIPLAASYLVASIWLIARGFPNESAFEPSASSAPI